MAGQGKRKPILGKVFIAGRIRLETGLHIGGSQANMEIGGLDKPVVRHPVTQQPYIPGSSLKGKLRALLERKENLEFNHHGGRGVYRHECTDSTCKVCRLFGSADPKSGIDRHNLPARLLVRDAHLTKESAEELEQIDTGLRYTEWKWENALDRVTSAAMPRQIERVPAGAEFDFEMVYTVETGAAEAVEDLRNVLAALGLLQDDTLGGHGSRGYGKVSLQGLRLEWRPLAYYRGEVDKAQSMHLNDVASAVAQLAVLQGWLAQGGSGGAVVAG